MRFLALKKKLQFSYPGYQFSLSEMAWGTLSLNLLSLAVPLLTLQVYDRIIQSPETGTLYALTTGVCLAIVVEMAIKTLQAYNMMYAASVFEHALTVQLVKIFLLQKKQETTYHDIGEFLNTLTAIGKLKEIHSGQTVSDWVDLPFMLLFLVLIAFFGGWLVLVPAAILTGVAYDTIRLSRDNTRGVLVAERSKKKKYRFMIDTLLGMHSIKSSAWEENMSRRFEYLQDQATQSSYRLAHISALLYEEGITAGHMMTILMATVGAARVLEGDMTVGALTACVMLSGRLMQLVQKTIGLSMRFANLQHAYSEIKSTLHTPIPTFVPSAQGNQGMVIWDEVSLYTDSGKLVLQDFSLPLAPGQGIYVEGTTPDQEGAFIELLFGRRLPHTGSCQINGTPPSAMDPDHLAEQMAYLPTRGQLFKGTIEENISRFGKIPKSRVYALAAALGIEQEINKLPAGFETPIEGSRMAFIPPGIKQGITLCRALGPEPRIVIYHHAEYALDPRTYHIFLQYLQQMKPSCCLVIISRDPHMQQLAEYGITLPAYGCPAPIGIAAP